MTRLPKLIAISAAAALMAGVLVAQEQASPEQMAHEARENQMHLQSFNLSKLGPMAQGAVEYDAAAAQSAADSLSHLAQMLGSDLYWLPGSSSEEVEGSRALPAAWERPDDLEAQIVAFQEATANLQAVAGTDLAALQGALGPVGQSCGSCHEAFRAPAN